MLVIPAVDIKAGRCVRLYQGRMDAETVYGDDPSAMAARWQKEGARYLHVVDLDGAVEGAPRNLEALENILRRVTIPLQFGGGLRDLGAIRKIFVMGASRVILGTAAITDIKLLKGAVAEYGERVFVGLDMKGDRLAVEGWTREISSDPFRLMEKLEKIGAGGIVCTDVSADGTLKGPNTELIGRILSATPMRVIAAGGIESVEHLRSLRSLGGGRLYGVIIGRALYAGKLTLSDALRESGEKRI